MIPFIPFIQAHWLAILFGEYFLFVCIVFNTALSGSVQDVSELNLKHLEYFFLFFFGLPLFLIELLKNIVIRRFTDG